VALRFKDLDWLVADSTLSYTVADGQLIGDWARVKRFLKDAPTRLTTLDTQGTLCLSQLDDLMSAIRQGATVDATLSTFHAERVSMPASTSFFARRSASKLASPGCVQPHIAAKRTAPIKVKVVRPLMRRCAQIQRRARGPWGWRRRRGPGGSQAAPRQCGAGRGPTR